MKRVEGVGAASIFKGDPRLPSGDVDAWLLKVLENNPSRVSMRPYLYGSDAGFCARRNVLVENNSWLDGNTNAAGFAFMAIGVALEDLLADSLRRAGRLVVQGTRLIIMPELYISGKMDLVVFDHEDNLAVIEVKTCGEFPAEPKPQHLAQLQTYMAVSGIQTGYLTYISRRLIPLKPIPTKTFVVEATTEAREKVLGIAALSRLAADALVLPPAPATFRKHTECHYCEFRDYFCHGSRHGDEPTSPLQEATPYEMIRLSSQAATLAVQLASEDATLQRLQATLVHLAKQEGVSPDHIAKLRELATP